MGRDVGRSSENDGRPLPAGQSRALIEGNDELVSEVQSGH